jgi:hypothetical protein
MLRPPTALLFDFLCHLSLTVRPHLVVTGCRAAAALLAMIWECGGGVAYSWADGRGRHSEAAFETGSGWINGRSP